MRVPVFLTDSPTFSLRQVEHSSGRHEPPDRSGAGRDSEGEHPGAQRRGPPDSTAAHDHRHHREGFPGGQWAIVLSFSRGVTRPGRLMPFSIRAQFPSAGITLLSVRRVCDGNSINLLARSTVKSALIDRDRFTQV